MHDLLTRDSAPIFITKRHNLNLAQGEVVDQMQTAAVRPSPHRHWRSCDPCERRAGICASSELLLILLVAALLILFIKYLILSTSNSPADARAVSMRPIYDLSVDDDERHLWVNRFSEDLVRLDAATGEVTLALPTQGRVISAMAHNHDGSLSLVCAADGFVTLFHDGNWEQPVELSGTEHFEAAVSGNTAVALAALGGEVHGFYWREAKQRKFTIGPHHSDVRKFGVNSTVSRMFVARRNGSVSFYHLETLNLDGTTLNVGTGGVAFAWSQDERLFATLSEDLIIRVFDVLTGRMLHQGTLEVPFQPVISAIMKFSPDQQRIAVSTSCSNEIQIWEIETGTVLGKLNGHESTIHALQFSADSERLFSGSYDGTIREWDLKTISQLRIVN
jgi:WD40 repeat protein